MFENNADALDVGPSALGGATMEVRRAAYLAELLALEKESAELVVKKKALSKQKGEAKRREEIQERLVAIADETADYQRLLAAVDFNIKAAVSAAACATTSSAACAATSSAAPAATVVIKQVRNSA